MRNAIPKFNTDFLSEISIGTTEATKYGKFNQRCNRRWLWIIFTPVSHTSADAQFEFIEDIVATTSEQTCFQQIRHLANATNSSWWKTASCCCSARWHTRPNVILCRSGPLQISGSWLSSPLRNPPSGPYWLWLTTLPLYTCMEHVINMLQDVMSVLYVFHT